jgi:tRNA A-37 threonylcarbamoyl transferase component Bud32
LSAEPDRIAVRDLLAEYLYGGRLSSEDSITVSGPRYAGYNSRVFKVACPQLPSVCALKFCLVARTLEPDSASARHQFTTLKKIARATPAGNHLRVPAPVFLIEDQGVLLTEWVSGKNLSDIFFSIGCSRRRADHLIKQAAAWLYYFHAANRRSPGTLDTANKLGIIARHETVKDPIFAYCHLLLRQLAEASGAMVLPRSWVHGDFKADNLIFSRKRVFGLDIHAKHKHVVINDIAEFLNQIELDLTPWRCPQLYSYKTSLFQTFITRYCGNIRAASLRQMELALTWFRAYKLLHRWNIVCSRRYDPLRSYLFARQYRSAVAAITRDLESFL